jgi:hypothetical protein
MDIVHERVEYHVVLFVGMSAPSPATMLAAAASTDKVYGLGLGLG